jgi:hypothetical protein
MNFTKQKLVLIHILVIPAVIVASLYLGYFFKEEIDTYLTSESKEENISKETEYYTVSPDNLGSVVLERFNANIANQVNEHFQLPLEIYISINNSTLEEGARTAFFHCNYLLDDKEIEIPRGGLFALDKLIPINQKDSIILRDGIFDTIECIYNGEGERVCPNPQKITVKNCLFLYSTETKESLDKWLGHGMFDWEDPLKLEKDSGLAELLRNGAKVVIEEIDINKTLDIEYLPY